MLEIGAHEAQTRFAEVLMRVRNGEEVHITDDGEQVAVMLPPQGQPAKRPAGSFGEWRALVGSIPADSREMTDWVREGRP